MAKILFFDVETTGLSHKDCAIHQLSAIIEIDGVIKERFELKIRPFEFANISQRALEVSNSTLLQIMSYSDQKVQFSMFITHIELYVNKFDKSDKFHLSGFNNSRFDNEFLRSWFIRNGNDYFNSYFYSDSLDVMILASSSLLNVRSKMPNFKLQSVAVFFGIVIDESKLHDANYDIELTYQIYKKILQNSK